VTHSIVQAPLQSELHPVFKSTSQDQKTPFWSSFNHHPVSLISLAAHLYFSSSSFHPSYLISYLSSFVHLLLVHIGGSAAMPSHIQRGPSVAIPSVRRPKLSHQRLHPHFIVQVGRTLSKALHPLSLLVSTLLLDVVRSHLLQIAAFVQPWLVMVSIASNPCETGNLTMKSSATVSKGIASSLGYIGCRGTLVGLVLTLWH
jgi:hypothetical protein